MPSWSRWACHAAVSAKCRAAGAQQVEEVGAALRSGGGEEREVVVADLGAEAVFAPVAGSGIVNRNPVGMGQSGPQHVAGLGDEGVVGLRQDPHHLPLGNIQPQRLQKLNQARDRRLALVVLGQDEALEFGAKVVADSRRQRRHHRAPVRRQPALPAIAYHPDLDLQVLDRKALVALEPRPRRDALGRNHPLFDRGRRLFRPPPPFLPRLPPRTRFRRFVHPRRNRRLDVRLALQPFQTRNLGPQRRVLRSKAPVLLQKLQRQGLQQQRRHRINVQRRLDHDPTESRNQPGFNPLSNDPPAAPGVLPLLPVTPVPAKSRTLRVARARLWTRAVATSRPSITGKGRRADRRPQVSATAPSMPSRRSA